MFYPACGLGYSGVFDIPLVKKSAVSFCIVKVSFSPNSFNIKAEFDFNFVLSVLDSVIT